MKALVIGYGSIGERHARVLESLGLSVAVVSRRGQSGGRPIFGTIEQAMTESFDYAVVASETSAHGDAIARLAAAEFCEIVLVDKPLLADPAPLPAHRFRRAGVGYNLRFHPAVAMLRAELAGAPAEIADFHIGQWLADWRPTRRVDETYSASRAGGGGALRDLSHELDLITWLLGPWRQVAAMGGRLGAVTVDADDGWGVLLSCARCPVVTLQMNCLDRRGRRRITVQSLGKTLYSDLVSNVFESDRGTHRFTLARDDTYAAMHQAMIDGGADICGFEEGLNIVKLASVIETAARERRWVAA